ncbi:hypothetical protein [Aquamicrobium sp.]|uniref:hypothetical protein n=1 Tax=Aquamicrobium sp. TaxID=1872579 RepID=UPI0025851CC9|nr:hypothetical protein [Aquamicrobium sp.]MCK9549306.1 hypothetical protein [Aquamicrobium sp.]
MMTHNELCDIAEKWLRGHCKITAKEIVACTATRECADAIGFTSSHSILIECKTSRADFLADLKKPFRQSPELGMGDYRLYLCPRGLIQPNELPPKWGLLWVYEDGNIERIIAPKGNIWSNSGLKQNKSYEAEYGLLYSLLRRGNERLTDYLK